MRVDEARQDQVWAVVDDLCVQGLGLHAGKIANGRDQAVFNQ